MAKRSQVASSRVSAVRVRCNRAKAKRLKCSRAGRSRQLGHSERAIAQAEKGLSKNIASEGAWAPALHFRAANGVVTIIGVIPTTELKQVVEDCVRRVPGVVRVEGTIEVGGTQGGAGDADQVLVARVREYVLPQIQVSGIDFQCHGG